MEPWCMLLLLLLLLLLLVVVTGGGGGGGGGGDGGRKCAEPVEHWSCSWRQLLLKLQLASTAAEAAACVDCC
jgi:hypothetical protein